MSEIKRIGWHGVHGMQRDVSGEYVLHSDHEAEVGRWKQNHLEATKAGLDAISQLVAKEREIACLRGEVEVGEKNLAAAMDQLAESDAENAKLEAVANAARQVTAWFTSGNSVPVSGVHQMTVSSNSIMADVHALNEALAAMGESA